MNQSHQSVQRKILAIRNKARRSLGLDDPNCPVCMGTHDAPFRQQDSSGKIVAGCVDACHGESLAGQTTNSARWHTRPEAYEIRRSHLKFITR